MTVPAPRPEATPITAPEPAPRGKFAFLVHPRNDVRYDMANAHPLLGRVPNKVYESIFERFPVRPWNLTEVRADDRPDEVLGWVLAVPLTPRQLLGDIRLARRRIDASVDLAVSMGADVFGLGALTAPATGGGQSLRKRTDIGVTNGNAFTAAVTAESVRKVLAGFSSPVRVAMVGATGSVGTAVARLAAREPLVDDLLLVARNTNRLEALAAKCGPVARVSTDMDAVRDADVVVLLTSAADAVLEPRHLKHGAVVIDDTQPRNTSPEVAQQRPDVTILDGGIVLTSGLTRKASLGLARDQSFACLSETALLALEGHKGHGTIGHASVEEVDRLWAMAQRWSSLGFRLADPTSFGVPVSVPGWNVTRDEVAS